MKFVFSAVEYNPFHTGHAHHKTETLRISGADAFVGVMSGDFTQRGLPAAADKYARAEAAVRCGVDCVAELPFPYAAGAAPDFALGAVKIMNAACGAGGGFISFGSECGDLSALSRVAAILSDEPSGFKDALHGFLETGLSYPAAQSAALAEFDAEAAAVLAGSNDILAVEYLKALKATRSPLLPLAVKRTGGSHTESATNIRNILSSGGDAAEFLPAASAEIITEKVKCGAVPDTEIFGSLLLYKLRSASASGLNRIYDISEGLENRLKAAAREAADFESLLEAISTKRYSPSRLRRILLYALVGLTKPDMKVFKGLTPYIKILALKKSRKDILTAFSKSGAHIITRAEDYYSLPPALQKLYDTETAAAEIYVLLNKNKTLRVSPQGRMVLV